MSILLGVAGGIAAYKSAELARALIERGQTVQVLMTRSAQEFVRPLTFAALTGRKVLTDMFDVEGAIEHIQVTEDNDLLVVAPATADVLAKFAAGIADDFLSTVYLAFIKPVVLAPAMNTKMWQHPATRRNVETLRARGHVLIDPESGELACRAIGPGRLAEPSHIADVVLSLLHPQRDLAGDTVLITAGPTQEPIDPVRFLSNRSSGRMGYAIAEAAAARGASVVLVSGPVSLPDPVGVRVVRVTTAHEMRDAVMRELPAATIVIKAAAVADYYVPAAASEKLKKTAAGMTLELASTPDILAEIGCNKGKRIVVGFAAETSEPTSEARRKLLAKNADIVVGNVATSAIGAEDNEVVLVTRDNEVRLPRLHKREVAGRILDHILQLR